MKQLLLAALFAIPGFAIAIEPCPTGTGTCPTGTICLSWSPPLTQENGASLSPSEIARYEVQLGSMTPISTTNTFYNYVVPAGSQVTTGDTWSVFAIDKGDLKSKPASCLQPVTVAVPKPSPAAPTGLGIITGK